MANDKTVEQASLPIDRRTLLAGLAGAAVVASAPAAAHTPQPLRLWYQQPAARWEEALPIGNGRLGAMVFGRPGQERLQLNEDTLWAGGPYTPDNPDALDALPEVRRHLQQGDYVSATRLAGERMMARPLHQMSYGSLGDLFIDFEDANPRKDYVRALNLETAISETSWSEDAQAPCDCLYRRDVFASAPAQVIVMRIEAGRDLGSFGIGWRAPRPTKSISPSYSGPATELMVDTPPALSLREEIGPVQPDTRIQPDGENAILITGRNEAGENTPSALTYAIRVRVVSNGQIEADATGLRISGGQTATILIAAATSFRRFNDVGGDPVSQVRTQTEAAALQNYASLRQAHIADYQSLFSGVSLDLGKTPEAERPTDLRIVTSENGRDPALDALYFQYARYLLISSSRPGTQPANLQGIWNEGTNPPWGSKYTININTEMNYWPADPAGLGECAEPLLRMVEDLSITGAKTARTMYNARGWVCHHNTDLWRAAAPIDGPLWGLWPCGGAWLCNSLWDHYDYCRDPALLRRLYPLMKGASQFFLDTLVEDPGGRGLITSPSLSPENAHPFGSSVCAGPAMDRQIIRDLFTHTADAGKDLERDSDFLASLLLARNRLAPDCVGKTGQLQEWLEDWDSDAPEPHHRHVSHLYAVYPSGQINVRDTPDLLAAARTSLQQRGDLATGWGTAWRLCLWARMGDGDHAYNVLRALVGPQRTYPNLFDAHPPFQIDGNFGGAAGIMEMLVQSWGGEIHLLPALPSAWRRGEVKGLRVRGNMTIDLVWRDAAPAAFVLRGTPGATAKVRRGNDLSTCTLDSSGRFVWTI